MKIITEERVKTGEYDSFIKRIQWSLWDLDQPNSILHFDCEKSAIHLSYNPKISTSIQRVYVTTWKTFVPDLFIYRTAPK